MPVTNIDFYTLHNGVSITPIKSREFTLPMSYTVYMLYLGRIPWDIDFPLIWSEWPVWWVILPKNFFQIFVHLFSRYRGFSDKNRTFHFFSSEIINYMKCDAMWQDKLLYHVVPWNISHTFKIKIFARSRPIKIFFIVNGWSKNQIFLLSQNES